MTDSLADTAEDVSEAEVDLDGLEDLPNLTQTGKMWVKTRMI